MTALVEIGLPALFVVLVWWASTGLILFLDSLPERTYATSLKAAAAASAVALAALVWSSAEASVANAYVAFVAAIVVWGLIEMAFLMGTVTGPRTSACPETCTGAQRFWLASLAIAYHEAALVAALVMLLWLTWGLPNQAGAWTFGLLWIMRLSTKLNIFLGVANLPSSLLPARIAYLESYFRQAPMNWLFPISITATTALCVALGWSAVAAASRFDMTVFAILATLAALALIEHWLLMVPLPAEKMWAWSMNRKDGSRDNLGMERAMPSALGRRAAQTAL
jgi:putative photosynthetic complex assembly protein 2